jgi:hypothetical protein
LVLPDAGDWDVRPYERAAEDPDRLEMAGAQRERRARERSA